MTYQIFLPRVGLVNPLDLQPEQINLTQIAECLHSTRRFNGLGISVLDHCINMYHAASTPEAQAQCLLHDAAEAYIGDIAGPLKSGIAFVMGYGEIEMIEEMEDRILRRIFAKYGVSYPLLPEVQRLDLDHRALELFDLKHGFTTPGVNYDVDLFLRLCWARGIRE